MSIRRVVPDITCNRIHESRKFYTEFLGFDVAMDMDWVVTLVSPVHAEWLKLSFPADYRGSANRIEVTATASASSGFVLTEEQRLKLIAQVSALRRRIANLTAFMKESFIHKGVS